jgi:phosphatidylserine/phosphatidylglycerophosphate/cardiolipin synthase-like enzyme
MQGPSSSELVLPGLDPAALEDLASALASERLRPPFTAATLRRLVAADQIDAVRQGLTDLVAQGFSPVQSAALLRVLAVERRSQRTLADRLELVWSGPAVPGQALRDTAVVVRSLCQAATRSVLVANFSFDQQRSEPGISHARALWQPLADAMTARPELAIRMIVNVARDDRKRPNWTADDWRDDFIDHFINHLWPAQTRRPPLYYDPRALDDNYQRRAIMHAKCVVIDLETVFLSSANFSHAGQERNIEAGLVVADPSLARQVTRQFEALIAQGSLAPLPLERVPSR